MTISRRSLVVSAGAGLAAGSALSLPAAGAAPGVADVRATAAARPLRATPFTLGVASGDPLPDGFVIWTRLAPAPLAEDGLGGMPSRRYPVLWQVATDERFRRVVRSGVAGARPDTAHAVHVEVEGLRPGGEYWYRFRVGRWLSPVGRARTAPAPDAMPSALTMAFASCSQFEHGFFTAYRRLAEDEPDLVLHLGDYQYEYAKDTYVVDGGNVRDHRGPETETLANYRQRHAQYKTDADLQAAHAAAPWLVVWDDHEVDNNWADEVPEKPEIPQPRFLDRRAAAFRAFYENMPLRRTSVPRGIDLQLFRRVAWGRLATFHMLDTRQYRDDQACGDGYDDCPDAADPRRTLTGAEQERWLLDGFARSRQRWDVLGQQVFFSRRDSTADPSTNRVSMDAWDGYPASRRRITQGWLDAGVRNPVVLTGDVHAHWASDIAGDFDDPDAPVVGAEFVTSSITSGGDGYDDPQGRHPWADQNPHLRFWTNLRGYVSTRITPTEFRTDFRCLPRVSEPGAAAFTRASFLVEDGVPGMRQLDTAAPRARRSVPQQDREKIIRDTLEQETR
ncbi:alkaline phosphatase D family protein [Nocardioides panacisoli]|uniref:alkaline phosphatase D family protein n=1 Tax=Nocardioides panacisoli TaxID=627624 RepID=UPI001C632ECE|nr:alkaline phosphatase D family protein [Nocardioides panacisoli]QYJ03179.1 alkaline phosphatase D family protein [Nocardioides panacisoli]